MKHHFYLAAMLLLILGCNSGSSIKEVASANDSAKQEHYCCTPKTTDKDWYSDTTTAPLFDGLSGIDFKISTNSSRAQQYFNQGMMLSYGFNHAEAGRSFYQSMREDSNCAMCYWGFAYVLGPNYNGGMEADNFQRAYDAVQKALKLSVNSNEKEKALIDALTHRYAKQPPENRSELDKDYAAAMKKVYTQYPDDADIGALYAESLMDLHPWDLYEKKTKQPKSWTPEIIAVLEHLIKQNPNHPGAHHFYIHALEASATPERALQSAKLIPKLVPGSGHLVHMPAHIYINTGDYHLATLANLDAIKVDSNYTTSCHAQGVYPLAYYPHNYHFLIATATLEGNSKLAWMASQKMRANTSLDIMQQPGWGTLQHYYTIPFYVAVKLAMWDTILAFKPEAKELIYPNAVLHYARGMAYLGKNDIAKAQLELTELTKLANDTSLKALSIWGINTTADLMQIAVKVLKAELLEKQGNSNDAIALLKEAVALEDQLNYDEPPDWFFSVRHYLGEELLKAGKFAEAEKVFLEDLKTWKENGWALIGLYTSLQKQNKTAAATTVKTRFDKAWQFADFKITSSTLL